ncbi:uncharacterized protein LOC109509573, partial [Hippocampus comes]|uniref:uncharacterized protein LOC109509573 n=1 Tax=Hippocampus comes TaxID=109280 RepID=UPI00094ED902
GVQNFSKRVCTEQKGDLEPVARSQQPAISALRRPPSSSSSPTREPSNSASRSPPTSALTNGGPQRSGSVRHRRFLKTADILRQSGLLDITLRTKELLRQSNATEREIAELRWHTELLCQAACSSPNGTTTWQRVHRTMADSNRYADLQHLRLPAHWESAGRLESAANEASQRRDPSARLSETQRQNCAGVEPRREFLSRETSPEKVTFVPPDSSTG